MILMDNSFKNIDDLRITDDFLFGEVMSDPEICKPLLEYILDIKIDNISYPEKQKVIDVMIDAKSIRLDIFTNVNDDSVADMEAQNKKESFLGKRVRYYHGMIDLNIINKGEKYSELKNSYVIFICTYDPFGKGRYIYTFERRCKEDDSVELKDAEKTIILNTKGTVGEISDELKSVLNYMNGQAPTSDYTKKLDKKVSEVKSNDKFRREFMTLQMRYNEEREIGKEIGKEIGEYKNKISAVRSGKGIGNDAFLMKVLGLSSAQFSKISNIIDSNPGKSDYEIAEEMIASES